MSEAEPTLIAGRVGKSHGLDGSFYVTHPVPRLLELGNVVYVSGRAVEVIRRAGTDVKPILKLKGFETRELAAQLRGEDILIPRDQAPPLGEDEWYEEDLVGLAVMQGELTIGTVKRLMALPSCEVLEVERKGKDVLLVPLVRDAVKDVDLDRAVIQVDLNFLGES